MQTQQLITVSWIIFFGTSAILWAVTSGLVNHFAEIQNCILNSRLSVCLGKLFGSGTPPAANVFTTTLNECHIKIAPIPDVLNAIRTFRTAMLAGLMLSACFNCVPLAVTIFISPDDLKGVSPSYRVFCGLSLIIDLLCVASTFMFPALTEIRQIVGELFLWKEIKEAWLSRVRN